MSAFDACSKPGCPGVIGSDLTCSVCGSSAEGEPLDDLGPEAPAPESASERADAEDPGEEDPGDEDDWDQDEDPDEDNDWDDEQQDDEADEELEEDDEDIEDDDEDRMPCPDGACIGVIGPDGLCTECGLPADDDGPEDEEEIDDSDEAREEEGAGGQDQVADQDERIPCPDGSCIGIIGPDGRCCECGRRA
jgi:hypothetical protein